MGEDKGWNSERKGERSYWRRNRKDRDVNRDNYNTLLNISQSKKEPKERSQEKKGGKAEGLDLLSPRLYINFEPYTFAQRQRVSVPSRFGLNSVIDVIVFDFCFGVEFGLDGLGCEFFFSLFFVYFSKYALTDLKPFDIQAHSQPPTQFSWSSLPPPPPSPALDRTEVSAGLHITKMISISCGKFCRFITQNEIIKFRHTNR